MRGRRRAGTAILQVLIAAAVLAGAATAWRASFAAIQGAGERGVLRAQARAVARAAWARARRDLVGHRGVVGAGAPLAGGAAAVAVEELGAGRRRVTITARVADRHGQPVVHRLRLEVRVEDGRLRVLGREELGG